MLSDPVSKSSKVQYRVQTQHLKLADINEESSKEELEFSNLPLYFAEGFEKVFLVLYLILLPYITGLLFLFFYISDGDYKLFLSLDHGSSFLLTWAIGYEILALLSLLYIIKIAITFSRVNIT